MPNRSMAASATIAPAARCPARPSDTPGIADRAATVVCASRSRWL
jgi:hypothetical protein